MQIRTTDKLKRTNLLSLSFFLRKMKPYNIMDWTLRFVRDERVSAHLLDFAYNCHFRKPTRSAHRAASAAAAFIFGPSVVVSGVQSPGKVHDLLRAADPRFAATLSDRTGPFLYLESATSRALMYWRGPDFFVRPIRFSIDADNLHRPRPPSAAETAARRAREQFSAAKSFLLRSFRRMRLAVQKTTNRRMHNYTPLPAATF